MIGMNNVFKEIPWSTIKVLKFIVNNYDSGVFVDAIDIRKHFKFKVLEEQRTLEILELEGFIDHTASFFGGHGIYKFRVTAKALTAFESFKELLIIYLLSGVAIPATVSVIVTLLTNLLLK